MITQTAKHTATQTRTAQATHNLAWWADSYLQAAMHAEQEEVVRMATLDYLANGGALEHLKARSKAAMVAAVEAGRAQSRASDVRFAVYHTRYATPAQYRAELAAAERGIAEAEQAMQRARAEAAICAARYRVAREMEQVAQVEAAE